MPTPTETIDSVIHFWFGVGTTATAIAEEKSAMWWSKNDAIDREIKTRFAAITHAAADGSLGWAGSPRGLLALIIATDQFPRNMHRGTAAAFACDATARAHARECDAAALTPIQRVFAYLPFEHSEDAADQAHSVALYQQLADDAAATDTAALFADYLQFAIRHRDIIDRFGRFPHRNQILGRQSTAAEVVMLEDPESWF